MQVINIKERLEIPQYGYIVLIDSANMKSCRIDKPCRDILKNIISANKATIEQLTERYFRYIWGKMCGGKEVAANSTREQIVTATYRDIDSIRTDSVAISMSGSESTCKAVACKADNSQNTKCPNAQCTKAPCTQAKCPNAQCKEEKCPNAQCKEAKCPNAQCKEEKCPNAQCKEHKCIENK